MKIADRKIQFIWWGHWIGFGIKKWKYPYNYYILDFSILICFFEIRVWLKGKK